jgi:hypothetical protein
MIPKSNTLDLPCDVCGAPAGEGCKTVETSHPADNCSTCRAIRTLVAAGAMQCAGGDRELAGWFPGLAGDVLAQQVRRTRAELGNVRRARRRG